MPSIVDLIVNGLESFLRDIFHPVRTFLSESTEEVLRLVVSSPHPNSVFSRPTNGAWPSIYDYYWESIVPLSLLLWGLAIGLIILLESTSHLFSSYHRNKLKKRAFSGLVGILSWWWMASLSLRFMDGLGRVILPSLDSLSMFDTASFGSIGVLGFVVALLIDLSVLIAIGLVYYIRHIMLYLFTLMMPLLIVFWVPGVGPFQMMSQLAKRLAGFYFPFLFMTIPVAVLFRLSKLLGTSTNLSIGGFGQWLVAITIPILALGIPIVLFWQAGSIFFAGRMATRRASARRARSRIQRTRSGAREAATGSRNFLRGLRGEAAVRSDGQSMLGSGDSRSHAAGSRLRKTGSALSRSVSGGVQTDASGDGTDGSAGSRNTSFENLRDRSSSTTSSSSSSSSTGSPSDYTENDRPYYVN